MGKNQTQHSVGFVLASALFAGLLAGLVVAAFHLMAMEPVLQRAIDLEGTLKKASGLPVEPELFSRSIQHVGLFIGYVLYGIGWGALFGVAACLLPRLTRTPFSGKQGWGLLLASCWTVGIFPQLKYPANPPGVGDSTTIPFRQEVYLSILLLSILGTFLAAIVYQALGKTREGWQRPKVRLPLVAGLYLLYIGIVYVWLPNYSDPIRLPSDLMVSFHWLSVIGVLLFWLALGCIFVFFLDRSRLSKASGTPARNPET
jgi:Probable cobalt transporter subunit (CbtA)